MIKLFALSNLAVAALLALHSDPSFSGTAPGGEAQKGGDASPGTVEPEVPLGWLQGRWVGEGLGGTVEEVWLPWTDGAGAPGATMACIFRHVAGGSVTFYELVTITRTQEGGVMRLKHFHGDLRGWEEKDEALEWPMEPLEGKAVRFGPVTYELVGEDELRATVEIAEGEGSASAEFSFRRAPIGAPSQRVEPGETK